MWWVARIKKVLKSKTKNNMQYFFIDIFKQTGHPNTNIRASFLKLNQLNKNILPKKVLLAQRLLDMLMLSYEETVDRVLCSEY